MVLIVLLVLAVAWAVVIAIVLALCVGAAQGDRQLRDGQTARSGRKRSLRLIAG